MPYLTPRNIRHYYRQSGQGPDVIIIHGLTGNQMGWHLCGVVAEASRNFRVTTYDLRGHGLSDTPASEYTSADMAEDLAALMHALRIDSAIVVGHSYGAAIAMQLAARHPEMVVGVVNSDGQFPSLKAITGAPTAWPGWKELNARATALGISLSKEMYEMEPIFAAAAAADGEQEVKWREVVGRDTFERIRRLARTSCARDSSDVAGLTAERIASIRQPVHSIYGSMSPFVKTADYLQQNLAHSHIHWLADVEHFGFDESPDEFLDAMLAALAAISGLEISRDRRGQEPPRVKRRTTIMTVPDKRDDERRETSDDGGA